MPAKVQADKKGLDSLINWLESVADAGRFVAGPAAKYLSAGLENVADQPMPFGFDEAVSKPVVREVVNFAIPLHKAVPALPLAGFTRAQYDNLLKQIKKFYKGGAKEIERVKPLEIVAGHPKLILEGPLSDIEYLAVGPGGETVAGLVPKRSALRLSHPRGTLKSVMLVDPKEPILPHGWAHEVGHYLLEYHDPARGLSVSVPLSEPDFRMRALTTLLDRGYEKHVAVHRSKPDEAAADLVGTAILERLGLSPRKMPSAFYPGVLLSGDLAYDYLAENYPRSLSVVDRLVRKVVR